MEHFRETYQTFVPVGGVHAGVVDEDVDLLLALVQLLSALPHRVQGGEVAALHHDRAALGVRFGICSTRF